MPPEPAESLRKAQAGVLAEIPAERRILAMVGEVRRVGQWLVPQLLRVQPTATSSAAPIVRVVGSAYLGEVRVLVRDRDE